MADEHSCMYESTIAVMGTHVEDIKEDTATILKVLNGNGAEGLVTKNALNRQSINRLWWWLGGVSFCLLSGYAGLAFYVVKLAATKTLGG